MDVIVVLGRPCAGKSTLAARLAACLGAAHVSLGALIREARRDPRVAALTDKALRGEEMFDASWLASLLADAERAQEGLIVLDAAPPVDRVIAQLGWKCRLAVHLKLDTAFALARRDAGGRERADDGDALFLARSNWCVSHLPAVLSALARTAPLAEIDARWPPEAVLRQALSAWLLASTCRPSAAPGALLVEDPDSLKTRLDLVASLQGYAATALRAPFMPTEARPNGIVLLLKPGLGFPGSIFSEIEARAAKHGFGVRQVAVWTSVALRRSRPAAAHLDLAYLWATWPREIGGVYADELLPLRSVADRLDRASLAEIWQESGPVPPRKLGPCAWGVDLELPDARGILVNGHVEPFLDLFEAPDARVYAVLLGQCAPEASWREMRESFLGATHPSRAVPGSLRHDAWAGVIPLAGDVDFRNNGFHLSAGPLEAVREAAIWLGDATADAIAREMGLAGAAGCFNRPVAEVDGALLWSNEATEMLDASAPAFHSIAEQLGLSRR